MLILWQRLFVVIFFLAAVACGSSSSTTAASDDDGDDGSEVSEETLATTSTAITAVFTNTETEASLKGSAKLLWAIIDQFSRSARAAANDTCDSTAPAGVNFDFDGTAGSYGSVTDSVTLTDDDFCIGSDGQDNTGLGPDGDGLFNSFGFRPDRQITATCTAQGQTHELGITGEGVYRNTLTFVEIYGAFSVTDTDNNSHSADCTIILNTDGSVFSASCTDNDTDDEITMDADTSCELDVTSV